MIASLPMYDLPELRAETDGLWAAMRDALRDAGCPAPDMLDRKRPSPAVWTDPDLVLSQTCGMPWRLGLHHQAKLIGTPDYGVEGCPPGYYRSAIVVRSGDSRNRISDLQHGTCAFNARNSQSGNAVWKQTQFADWYETGAHAASITAVAEGVADIAAIDAVTWRLALRYQPEAQALRVLTLTESTPGLPYITSQTQDTDVVADAVTQAISALDTQSRDRLGINGLVRIPSASYLAV